MILLTRYLVEDAFDRLNAPKELPSSSAKRSEDHPTPFVTQTFPTSTGPWGNSFTAGAGASVRLELLKFPNLGGRR